MPCPFHLAIPVDDLDAARRFYGVLLGCSEGRSTTQWIDFDFFGHQLVAHLSDRTMANGGHSAVDGDAVPVPHFGIVLDMPQWRDLAERLRAAGVEFLIEPRLRFAGEAGEQGTLFIRDPAGNALEFKGFADVEAQRFRR